MVVLKTEINWCCGKCTMKSTQSVELNLVSCIPHLDSAVYSVTNWMYIAKHSSQ